MKSFVATLLGCVAMLDASAQVLPGTMPPVRSASGQFVVFAPSQPGQPALPPVRAQTNLVHLEATLVAVSAERIRQAVWNELGYSGAWHGRITISLRDAREADAVPEIECSRAISGWNYRIRMPDWIPGDGYMRTMVQAVLMELANRASKDQIAEIPPWLTEGLTAHLLANKRVELIIDHPQINMNGVRFSPPVVQDRRRVSQLEKAHKVLLGETPLTFEELSWPTPAQFKGAEGARFRACAQVLTHELLTLRGGRECMRNFLAELPAHLNWQLAFLAGFSPHFQRPLEIEKWWALQSASFAGRDLIQTWTYEESWQKLADLLTESVNVYGTTNELPMRAEVKLQAVVRDWDPAKQQPILRRKLADFEALRLRIAPELSAVATEYMSALSTCLNRPARPDSAAGVKTWASQSEAAMRRALVAQLDSLESRVLKMRPASEPVRVPAPPVALR